MGVSTSPDNIVLFPGGFADHFKSQVMMAEKDIGYSSSRSRHTYVSSGQESLPSLAHETVDAGKLRVCLRQ